MEREARSELRSWLEHFGTTPIARVRLGLEEVKRRTMHEELMEALGPSPRHLARQEPHEDPPRRTPLAGVLAEPEA